ncbi:hypothetical protein HanHA300_Chr09g0325911 [Helianthus annuus]|nr:hypothetical protein HanHA300_Chr09g0325911 [Helianthus annuus]KAJ0543078.1 hypothetical protein HanHA89_Chr09g0346831 [Helianthus annuus]KAJ0712090.1 hypothetical protein HanOQP8_Chr09g0331071 [Helianthus annuus]
MNRDNYSKVIINTGKPDLYAAQTYCDFLLETLQKSGLSLNPHNSGIHCYSWIRFKQAMIPEWI